MFARCLANRYFACLKYIFLFAKLKPKTDVSKTYLASWEAILMTINLKHLKTIHTKWLGNYWVPRQHYFMVPEQRMKIVSLAKRKGYQRKFRDTLQSILIKPAKNDEQNQNLLLPTINIQRYIKTNIALNLFCLIISITLLLRKTKI